MIAHNPFPMLRNWWCSKCRMWVASVDTDLAQRHRKCQTRCQWLEYDVMSPFGPIDRTDVNICNARGLA